VAVCLAVAAVALAVTAPRGPAPPPQHPPERASAAGAGADPSPAEPRRRSPPGDLVSAPVRIADDAAVRLLRPGDRVDVLAAPEDPGRREARVVAGCARVTGIPKAARSGHPGGEMPSSPEGALVLLTVDRPTASGLAAASADGQLAVTLC
jgi:hypothetical protein